MDDLKGRYWSLDFPYRCQNCSTPYSFYFRIPRFSILHLSLFIYAPSFYNKSLSAFFPLSLHSKCLNVVVAEPPHHVCLAWWWNKFIVVSIHCFKGENAPYSSLCLQSYAEPGSKEVPRCLNKRMNESDWLFYLKPVFVLWTSEKDRNHQSYKPLDWEKLRHKKIWLTFNRKYLLLSCHLRFTYHLNHVSIFQSTINSNISPLASLCYLTRSSEQRDHKNLINFLNWTFSAPHGLLIYYLDFFFWNQSPPGKIELKSCCYDHQFHGLREFT